ncbi:sodium-independent anion transporter, partial [Streptomyces parvus]
RAVAAEARVDRVDPYDGGAPDRPAPETYDGGDDNGAGERAGEGGQVVAYRVEGPLFFAGAHRSLLELGELSGVRVVILRMCRVTAVDATGALALKDTVHRLNGRGIVVLASGIRPGQRRALESVGALELLRREGREYATASEAFGGARERLAAPAREAAR